MVLNNNIPASAIGAPSVNIIPPANAVLNTILRMRVVTEHSKSPTVCGAGSIQRADDYGVYVKPACVPPTATIVNNSSTTVLTCVAPSISLTASGGVSYFWNNNKGITPTIAATEPGTYTVTVTSADGCTDTESIVITEIKPLPPALITNHTGSTAITCTTSTINVTASGGVSYSWDNDLGNNANVSVTQAGIYTVTVTAANGCSASKSIVITDEKTAPACIISSSNRNRNLNCGVTNVKLNTIDKTTTTFIPTSAMQDFVCTDNTTLTIGTAYNLEVTYQSRRDGSQFLEVWIDWDNNGIFQTSNSNGFNERVLTDNIPTFNTTRTATININPPATSTLNTLLRMRVITEYTYAPGMCNNGFVKRADDYGIIVNPTPTIWNGTTWSLGVPTLSLNAIIDANYNTNLGGSQVPFNTKKLTVNSGKSLTINSGTNLTVQNEVINNGSLIVENNANLIQVNDVSNTGAVTVNRDSSPLKRLDYTLWSSPVQDQQLQSFSPATIVNRFYVYNPATNLYNTHGPTNNFEIGKAYLIRTPNTHPETPTIWNGSFTGIPNNGTIAISVSNTTFNAIGNPYPSSINANSFIDANSLIEPLYFWRKTNNATYTSYATYTKAGGTANSGGLSSIEPNGIIQIGQGFIAKATSSTFIFNNAMRLNNNDNQFLKTKATERHRIWLNLSKVSEPVNQMMIGYMSEATAGIDNAFDGRYFGDSATALNSNIENQEFVIQAKGLPFDDNDIVPLIFKTNVNGMYSISIDHVDGLFLDKQNIFLKDNLLGLTQNIKENPYVFASSIGTFDKRFEMVYKNNDRLSIENANINVNAVLVFQKDKSIYINSSDMEMKNIIIYDILGRKILEKLNINKTSIKINMKANQQVLVLKITNQNNQIVTKKIVH